MPDNTKSGDANSTLPAPSLLDVDAARPSVSTLGAFTSFDKDKLDKEKSNWTTWSFDVYITMSLNRSYDYVTGDIPEPDVSLEPRAHRNWLSNDRSACAFLSSAISDAERKALGDPPRSGAKAYWEKLKARHSSDGPVAQVYLLKEALNIVISSPSESITRALDKAADLVHRAYAMSSKDGIAKETFLSIIALNILGKEHESIQFQLQDRMQLATDANPFTFTNIRAFLEDKQRLMDANKRQSNNPNTSANSIALSAQKASVVTCDNCGGFGHTDRYCVSTGGGMEGKSVEESRRKRRMDREAAKGRKTNMSGAKATTGSSATPKIQIPYQDVNGRALILEVDASAISASPNPTTQTFAGIASIPANALAGVASLDDVNLINHPHSTETLELEGWMATYDITNLPEARLPSIPISSDDFALSAVTQSNRQELQYRRSVRRGGERLDAWI
ncbi:hypothetical protein CVT26_006168 [Gymnopilus dilepis]|uniref:Uncharacterized protein n=1 Tax=Gymnopilus dilepis TaxID=231916 RepID=A0A409X6C9_9AGAR|nr:hypothetical protein CVT26_006168 [Gymnopilus dilepis]